MNQTRIVFLWGSLAAMFSASVVSGQLIQRSGKHIDLTTDLAAASEAETLVASFDAAAEQWLRFWKRGDASIADWKVTAYVMRDKDSFQAKGLIPDHIPEFPFGYAQGDTIWVLAQKSEYYTRHLLLHEGEHSFAFSQFGGAGPTWFMEGTAELLATHQGEGAQTRINAIPTDRESVPYWGRFKRMNQVRQDGEVPTLESVMRYQPSLSGDVATYGWSWAATLLLQAYPEYHDALHAAAEDADDGPGFNRRFFQQVTQQKWPVLSARWRMMCWDLDYGFDWSRERISISEADPIWKGQPLQVKVAANMGWQSAAVRFNPGTRIRLQPSGQIVLDSEPKPWVSEPPGVTVRYHRGRPLGQLLACVLPNAPGRGPTLQPLEIKAIEAETTLEIKRHSWLLLRVNDGVGELANNQGAYDVVISK